MLCSHIHEPGRTNCALLTTFFSNRVTGAAGRTAFGRIVTGPLSAEERVSRLLPEGVSLRWVSPFGGGPRLVCWVCWVAAAAAG